MNIITADYDFHVITQIRDRSGRSVNFECPDFLYVKFFLIIISRKEVHITFLIKIKSGG